MKPILNFPGYKITKAGKIWSEPKKNVRNTGKWLKGRIRRHGHLAVTLCNNGKIFNKLVHRLVLETYIGPCPKGMECRHLNGDPQDNRLENLRWGTKSDNQYDSVKHGTSNVLRMKGEKHPFSKLTENQVRLIFNAYHDGAYSLQELADYFNITRQHIWCIIKKKSWGHLW